MWPTEARWTTGGTCSTRVNPTYACGALQLSAQPIGRPLAYQAPTTPKLPIKCLTPAEIQEKREKGLSFNCDEKYNHNHPCKNRIMVLLGEEEDASLEELGCKSERVQLVESEIKNELSLHTLH